MARRTTPAEGTELIDSYEALGRLELIDLRLAELASPAADVDQAVARTLRGIRDEETVRAARDAVAGLPPRESGRAHDPLPHRIGLIADPFLATSFEGLATFLPVTPTNFEDVAADADVLLVASAWRGHDGASWRGVGTPGSKARKHLLEVVIPEFRRRRIPVVFYSKEDPPNYEWFVEIAAACDAVATTAEEALDRYRRDCPDVGEFVVVPFGVNPAHHSPIGSRQHPISPVFFAGSWHREKYPARARWGLELFDGVARSQRDLLVFDRNSDLRKMAYLYPGSLLPYVHGAVGHDFLMDLQRVSDLALNLNSVVASKTMYANRAIELQASGTVVLSNYNLGLNSRFPHVHLANSSEDVTGFIDTLGFEDQRDIQAQGIREAFTSNLSLYGLDRLLAAVGISAPPRGITALAVADSVDDRLRAQFDRQNAGGVEVVEREDLQRALDSVHPDVLLEVSTGHDYGIDYVRDHVNAYKYADTGQVGKVLAETAVADSVSHRYTTTAPAPGLGSRWIGSRGSSAPEESRQRIYSLDPFEVSSRVPERIAVSAAATGAPVLSVVVPIFNNGLHLKYKCIESLKRSSIFSQMEVVLVDDGSTDAATRDIVDELRASLPRVAHHRFDDGGSGSASRPRNIGLQLATGEFVTYLDPDNEATEDGYAHLVELLRGNAPAPLALGNMSRWSSDHRLSNNSAYLRQATGQAGACVPVSPTTLGKLKFRPVSIQALVARTAWLRELGLVQPVGAAGQDSYFFQQVLFHTQALALSDRTIHTYYAAVEDSTVNSIGARFFEKYRLLEIPRVDWLHEVGLFEAYAETRLEQYVRDWYLAKLAAVEPGELSAAEETLSSILELYAGHTWKDPQIRAFLGQSS